MTMTMLFTLGSIKLDYNVSRNENFLYFSSGASSECSKLFPLMIGFISSVCVTSLLLFALDSSNQNLLFMS